MNKISPRQLYFFLACVMPVGKLLVLPTLLARYAKCDLLFPVLVSYLIQAGVVFSVLLASSKRESLYDLLKNTFGRVASIVILIILSIFFFYAALLPLLEQRLFVQSVFYDTLPSLAAFAPFFLFSVYLCAKPLSSQGRVWDILGPLFLTGLAGILVLSAASMDVGALLPVGGGGIGGLLKGFSVATGWFFDGAILLMLLGRIDYQKGTAWKGTLFYLAGGIAVLAFLAVFYAVFQDMAATQYFAIAKTSKYFSGITVLGRIDYVFIYLLSLVMAFWCTVPLQAGIDCYLQPFGRERHLATVLSVAVNALFLVLLYLLNNRFGEVMRFITGPAFWIFPAFCILLPPFSLLLRRNHGRA